MANALARRTPPAAASAALLAPVRRVACGLASCAASPAMRAGRARGSARAPRRDRRARDARERSSNAEAASIAREVAGRELLTAPPADARPSRARDALPCAHELDERARRPHARARRGGSRRGARAHRGARLEPLATRASFAQRPRSELARRRRRARSCARPIATRACARSSTTTRSCAGRPRAPRTTPRTRPTSARCAEAARLDPEPIVRTEAVRAIAAMPPTPAARSSMPARSLDGRRRRPARRHRDRVGQSVDMGRRADARRCACSSPPGTGPGADRGRGRRPASRRCERRVDAGRDRPARSRPSRAGSRATRLQALAQAPARSGDELLDAIRKAAADDDLEVRVGALARCRRAGDHAPSDQSAAPFAPSRPRAARLDRGAARTLRARERGRSPRAGLDRGGPAARRPRRSPRRGDRARDSGRLRARRSAPRGCRRRGPDAERVHHRDGRPRHAERSARDTDPAWSRYVTRTDSIEGRHGYRWTEEQFRNSVPLRSRSLERPRPPAFVDLDARYHLPLVSPCARTCSSFRSRRRSDSARRAASRRCFSTGKSSPLDSAASSADTRRRLRRRARRQRRRASRQFEGMHALAPDNADALFLLAKTWTGYGVRLRRRRDAGRAGSRATTTSPTTTGSAREWPTTARSSTGLQLLGQTDPGLPEAPRAASSRSTPG